MPDTNALAIFLAGSAFLVWVSRASLVRLGSHGFWRFFAFEFILALVLLSLPAWFADPFSPRQIVSWVLLATSLILVGNGVGLLVRQGQPSGGRKDPGLLGPERTTRLVTAGAYRFIRHPMYASLLLFAWGAYLKNPAWICANLAVAATVFLMLTARAEEAENLRYFGEEYRAYMQRTKMFIPGVW